MLLQQIRSRASTVCKGVSTYHELRCLACAYLSLIGIWVQHYWVGRGASSINEGDVDFRCQT